MKQPQYKTWRRLEVPQVMDTGKMMLSVLLLLALPALSSANVPDINKHQIPINVICKNMMMQTQNRVGVYVPQCDGNGNFIPKQCSPSGHCWCVNIVTGEEIPNTRTPPGTPPVQCAPCRNMMQQTHKHGGYGHVPQCDSNGFFLPQQCMAATGYCWCVDIITGQEIPNTRTPPGTARIECAACRKMLQQSQNRVGTYVPQCDTSGNFLPQQCSPTGFCWCVNIITGEEVPNTRTQSGTAPVQCALCRNLMLQNQNRVGVYIQQCDGNGNFLPQQCSPPGHCWCVNIITGEEVLNTRTLPGTPLVECAQCKYMVQQSQNRSGAFVPQCDGNGNFFPKQCWPSIGHCWCVNVITGDEILNTRTALWTAPFECTPCKIMALQSQNRPGVHIPQCDGNGNYVMQQCSWSTGHCWCVNVITGEEIPNTKTPPGKPPVVCILCKNMLYPSQKPSGVYIPQCDSHGNYLPQQTSPNGYFWCVNVVTGQEIPNTRTTPGTPPIQCALCKKMMHSSQKIIGVYVPQCDDNGNFLPQQCLPLHEHCWCVNIISGQETPNTRTPPGTPPVKCATCQHKLHQGHKPVGGYVPQCDGNGNYFPHQFWPSTGTSWCVNIITGQEIPNTKTPPGTAPFECALCKNMMQQGHNHTGAYIPQCDSNGNYQQPQCWPSTGYCWCVITTTGTVILYTRTPPGTPPPDCAICRNSLQQSRTGVGLNIPQCDSNGNFLPQQCSPTGYCWCVHVVTGQEIVYTRTPPGTPSVQCVPGVRPPIIIPYPTWKPPIPKY